MDTTEIDVKAIRRAYGWTQPDLAGRMGVNLSTVWRWENGQAPRGSARVLLEKLREEAPKETVQ